MNRPENPSTLMAIPDVQSGSDERNLAIDQVGIRGLRYPLAFADGDAPAQSTIGTFAVMVALPEDRKGTHMSRLIEMLEELTAPGAAPLTIAGMRALLDPSARSVLDSLEASEGWLEGTRGLEAVRVVYIDPPAREAEQAESADVMLALQDSRGAYVLRWKASRVLDSWVFAGMQATSRERSRASEWDGLELASFEGDGAAPSIPPEVMAQLQALGIDLANPDAASLRAALASIRDTLPPEVLQALEALLAQLEQGGGADSDTAPGDEPPEDEPSEGPSDTTRKRTPSGPVDVPTRGPDGG